MVKPWAPWAALVVGWALLAWPWLSGRFTIPWDAKAHFLPQLQFLAASLARGDSPFWSPNVFSGHPQIADPQSLIFSPPFLLLASLDGAPSAWAMDATLYVMLLISAAAMLRWCLDKGLHPAAAVTTALSFAFGAVMAARIQHVGQVMSLAYLPIVLLLLDRALARASIPYGIAAGAAAALLVLGRDQVALLAVYFLIGYVVWSFAASADWRHALARGVPPIAAAGIAGLSIVAVPTLLTILVAANSNRPGIDLLGAEGGSLHPALLLTLLAPDVFGASGRMGEYWGPPSVRWRGTGLFLAQNMGQAYVGAIPALALIYGTASGFAWRREARIFSLMLAFMLLYALGWYTPAFSWMHALLPGVDLYRRPADAMFLIGFLLSVLSGLFLDRLLRAPRFPGERRAALLTALALAAAFATMFALARRFDMLESALPALAVPLALFGVAASVLVALRLGPPRSATVVTLLIALIVTTDLGLANRPGGATAAAPEAFDVLAADTDNETIRLLKAKTQESRSDTRRDRVEIVGFDFHWPNASLTHGLENTLGYNPLRLGLYVRATGAGDHAGLLEQKAFTALMPSYRSTLADMLGLRYIATSVPVETIDALLRPGDLTLIARTGDGYVYENPRAMPRVLFAPDAAAADFDALLRTGAWPDVDFSQTVLLEGAAGAPPRRPGKVRIDSYRNTEIILSAQSPDGGYVVLNDPWQPWWFATIDGSPAPLLRANVLFRAIAVPPGAHTLRLTFEPLRGAWNEVMDRK